MSKFGEKKNWTHERELALETACDVGKGDVFWIDFHAVSWGLEPWSYIHIVINIVPCFLIDEGGVQGRR